MLDSQLDNKSYQQIIAVFYSGFKNGPESLPVMYQKARLIVSRMPTNFILAYGKCV